MVIVVGLVLILDSRQREREPQRQAPAAANDGEGTRSWPGLAASLRVLRRAQRRSDALPRALAQQAQNTAGHKGIDPPHSRLAFERAGVRVYVVPGRRAVCVASLRGGLGSVGCGPPTALGSGFVFDIGADEGDIRAGKLRRVRVEGLLPDGVDTAEFALADHDTASAAVKGNAYYVILRSWPRRMTFTGPDGDQVVRFPQLPAELAEIAP